MFMIDLDKRDDEAADGQPLDGVEDACCSLFNRLWAAQLASLQQRRPCLPLLWNQPHPQLFFVLLEPATCAQQSFCQPPPFWDFLAALRELALSPAE